MKVLVTGANGFVGSTLCEALIKRGVEVRGLVRKTSDLIFLKGVNLELIYGDLGDKKSLLKATEGIDIVYHVAALASDWGSLELFRTMNVKGTRNVLESSLASKVKRFVYISSVVVHSFLGKKDMTEESPMEPTVFPYCISKKEAEKIVMEFYRKHKLPVTIVRPGDVVGPRDRVTFLKLVGSLKKGIVPYVNHGKSLFAFTYVENLVDGIILAGNSEKAVGEIYVITDRVKISWREYFEMLTKEMGVRKPVFSINSKVAYPVAFLLEIIYRILRIKQRPPVTRYLVAHMKEDFHFSIEKAKKELNYEPKIPPEEAIRRTVQWYREFRVCG